jgi:ATP-binding cassette, subfamily B, putative efflux pump
MSITQKSKSPFRRFMVYIKPYWLLIALAAVGGIVKFSVPMIFPQIMRYFIDEVLNFKTALSSVARIQELNKLCIIIIGIYLFIWIPGTYIRHYFVGKAGNRVIFDLRYDLFMHIQRMSASYFKDNQSGEIVSRIMNDIILAQNLIGNALTNIWIDGSIVIFLLFVMFKMNVVLTLVSLSIFPFYILNNRRLGRKVKKNSRMVQDEIAEMNGIIQERISGFSIVQAFAREKYEQLNFFKECRKLLSYSDISSRLSSINMVVTGFLTAVAPILVVWTAGQLIVRGQMSVGEMVVFYAYLGQFYMPINRFSELNLIYATSMSAIERIFETFNISPDVVEKEDAIEFGKDLKGEIVFKNVSFGYDEDRKVLNNINLTIKPGQRVAIVGSSGSGKSTLINLLPRFYDPVNGSITIDGVDIRDYKLKSLRQNIGMVLQETILFSGSLKENILYANLKASDKEIKEASRAANAYDFIMELPEKFETEVGERGLKLSGGQKQRIAITRVFAKNPKILILDEATSALDSESENLIQDALNRLMKGRTTIVIAHRLTTVIDADVIVVLDQGQLREIGNHEELIHKGGIYKHLFEEQFKDVMEMVERI